MISFEEARTRLLGDAVRLGVERVALRTAAGRVLAESVAAARPVPAADQSAMDGYALSLADLDGAGPWTLPVRGESRTGFPPPSLLPGTACRIFTGALMPSGADAVLMQEDARREGDSIVFSRRPRPGAHVRRAGEDLAAGAIALEPGARLGPGHLALAGMLGRADLAVARRPAVAVLCTGDELRPPGSSVEPWQLHESNGAMVAALAEQAGACVRVLAPVADDADATRRAVDEGLEGSDLLVAVGGVSVGDHDHVRGAFAAAGVSLDFWKVSMKPGKPLAVGRRGGARVLGLPGNPSSAMVTFALFGMPLLRAMQGDSATVPRAHRARLADGLSRESGRLEFARARLVVDAGLPVVHLHANQASGAATSLAWADALAVVPAEPTSLPAGATLDVLRLAEF